jgi:hypothetical protein
LASSHEPRWVLFACQIPLRSGLPFDARGTADLGVTCFRANWPAAALCAIKFAAAMPQRAAA